MTDIYVKTQPAAKPGFFAAEARGLELLRVPGGPPLPTVRELAADRIVVDFIPSGRPSEVAAEEFGRRLATMHATGLPTFGAEESGFIGPLPLDNTTDNDWPAFYAERRLLPYVPGLDSGVQVAIDRVIERLPELAGPAEPPARLHGDLWSGNLLWASDGQVWLVDAASAHGGHRETDLAMLALFGAPYLDRILASYQEVAPLADGWQQRVPLHQLHPLLVHAQLFGGHYVDLIHRATTAALSSTAGG